MDTGTKLERVLRHLKNAEPAIEHWMEFGDVGRSAEVDGVLLNSGWLNSDVRHMVDGLVLAAHFLAKVCRKRAQITRSLVLSVSTQV